MARFLGFQSLMKRDIRNIFLKQSLEGDPLKNCLQIEVPGLTKASKTKYTSKVQNSHRKLNHIEIGDCNK